jgi:hypothetical protein
MRCTITTLWHLTHNTASQGKGTVTRLWHLTHNTALQENGSTHCAMLSHTGQATGSETTSDTQHAYTKLCNALAQEQGMHNSRMLGPQSTAQPMTQQICADQPVTWPTNTKQACRNTTIVGVSAAGPTPAYYIHHSALQFAALHNPLHKFAQAQVYHPVQHATKPIDSSSHQKASQRHSKPTKQQAQQQDAHHSSPR